MLNTLNIPPGLAAKALKTIDYPSDSDARIQVRLISGRWRIGRSLATYVPEIDTGPYIKREYAPETGGVISVL